MRKSKGFTLIEVMIAMIVIIMGAIVGFEFFRYCKEYTTNIKLDTVALNRARQIMEYKYWDPTPTSKTYPGIDELPGTDRGEVVVADRGDYKTVAVTVTWNE